MWSQEGDTEITKNPLTELSNRNKVILTMGEILKSDKISDTR